RQHRRSVVEDGTNRSDVVQDPEGTAMRGQHQVALWLLDDQIVNRYDRQIAARKRVPRATVVERHVYARLCTRVQQPAPGRILANDAAEDVVRQAGGDARPGRSVVVGLEQI